MENELYADPTTCLTNSFKIYNNCGKIWIVPKNGIVDVDATTIDLSTQATQYNIANDATIAGTGYGINFNANSVNSKSAIQITTSTMATGNSFKISAGSALSSGHALFITGGTGTTMTTGSLLKLESSAQTPSNGVMQLLANSVTSGTVLKVSGTSVTDGNIGRIISSGIRAGNGLLIDGGTGTTMTTGSLLKLDEYSNAFKWCDASSC